MNFIFKNRLFRDIAVNLYGYSLSKKRFNKNFREYYDKFLDNLNKDKNAILEEQFILLKESLAFSYNNIEYYKNLFDYHGLVVDKFNDPDQLKKLPVLTKDIIRENFDQLYNKNVSTKSYIKHSTSGSTGAKLNFLVPLPLRFHVNAAVLYRHYKLYGVDPFDKRVTLGGRDIGKANPPWIYNFAEKQLIMSAHQLTHENCASYVDKIEKFKPVYIQGHPSAILFLAEYILNNNRQPDLELKAIFTTGETLVNSDRESIQKAFNTRVSQQYGSGENCFSAQEIPDAKGYYLNYEYGFVELVEEDGNYKVVATSFLNNVMPFVRYQIGDYVHPGNAPETDFPLPYLCEEVVGRIDDKLFDEKNNKILALKVRNQIKPFLVPYSNYQIIQEDINKVEVKLVDKDHEINKEGFEKTLKNILGDSCKINFNYVDDIITKGGKTRNVICKIK